MTNPADDRPIDRLLAVMARLRDPEGGCPWDLEQNYATVAPHTIEEAYEVADAIERGDMDDLKDELGDLLFQVVYYAQIAREEGLWDFDAVAAGVADKMIRRHPHVFGSDAVAHAAAQSERWELQKSAEREARAAAQGKAPSVLDGVITGLPALTRAVKLQKRVARVGFDWNQPAEILDEIEEEIGELRAELERGSRDAARVQDELGDLLFVVVNLARRLEVDPEAALRGTNAKVEQRFRRVEALLAEEGRAPGDATLDEMEALWQRVKGEEET